MVSTSHRSQGARSKHLLAYALTLVSLTGCPLANDGDAPGDGALSAGSGTAPRDEGPTETPVDPVPLPSSDVGVQRPTHSALISVQELSFPGLPELDSGITVQALFTAASRPDFEEKPGDPTGCRAWSYDMQERPPPAEEDHGTLELSGFLEGTLSCRFDAAGGYACRGEELGLAATPAGVPFVARTFAPAVPLTIALTPGGKRGFEPFSAPVSPGDSFAPSDATRTLIENVPTNGRSIRLDCAGPGGRCGEAAGTIVRITTTDADVTGLAPTRMPRALRKYVEISCATLGSDVVTIPAQAMELLREAHAASPITRIRTAFMRDGIALVANGAPNPPNRVVLAVGRAVVGFTKP